jgi:hypothetical protein
VAIVRELLGRRFRGALDADVFAVIDLEATTRAYEEALRVNLVLRRAGFAEAVELATTSRVAARRGTGARARSSPRRRSTLRVAPAVARRAARLGGLPAREGSPPLRSAHRARPAAEEEAEQIWQQILASAGPPR